MPRVPRLRGLTLARAPLVWAPDLLVNNGLLFVRFRFGGAFSAFINPEGCHRRPKRSLPVVGFGLEIASKLTGKDLRSLAYMYLVSFLH